MQPLEELREWKAGGPRASLWHLEQKGRNIPLNTTYLTRDYGPQISILWCSRLKPIPCRNFRLLKTALPWAGPWLQHFIKLLFDADTVDLAPGCYRIASYPQPAAGRVNSDRNTVYTTGISVCQTNRGPSSTWSITRIAWFINSNDWTNTWKSPSQRGQEIRI